MQVAGMKLEEEAAPQPKRNSAPLSTRPAGPVPGHIAAPLRNSAPVAQVIEMQSLRLFLCLMRCKLVFHK